MIAIILFTASCLSLGYLVFKFKQTKHFKYSKNTELNVVTVAGSGGHTTELIRILQTLEDELNSANLYFYVADTDKHSINKINKFLDGTDSLKSSISN